MTDKEKRLEVANLIERFVNGSIGKWEWDDFISIHNPAPDVEILRQEIASIPDRFPSSVPSNWCSTEGIAELNAIARRLRG